MNLLFGFSGRIGRGMWWLLGLVNLLIWALVVGCWTLSVHIFDFSGNHAEGELSNGALSLLVALLVGVVLGTWTNLAACTKRFHDRNKSGWWFLINFIPIIGPVWLIVELGILPGDYGGNNYGPPPGGGRDIADFAAEVESQYRPKAAARLDAAPARTAQTVSVAAAPAPRKALQGGFGRRGIA